MPYPWKPIEDLPADPSALTDSELTSLLVYWVHIEFVYGRFSRFPKRAETIPMASLGLLIIFTAMVLLSLARTRWKGKGAEILARLKGANARPAID